jgi:hypothetical protein
MRDERDMRDERHNAVWFSYRVYVFRCDTFSLFKREKEKEEVDFENSDEG